MYSNKIVKAAADQSNELQTPTLLILNSLYTFQFLNP